MSEINKQTEFIPGCFQVIHYLSTMFGGKTLNCLDLNNNFPETNEIRFINMSKFPFPVVEVKFLLFN